VIFVEREQYPVPRALFSKAVIDIKKRLEDFYSVPELDRKQERIPPGPGFARSAVFAHLFELFRGKCAYCESSQPGVIDHYRPTQGVIDQRGDFFGDHYWGLRYDWKNMYLCCNECNRSKGKRFPISGKRAPPNPTAQELVKEKPLLIDPCKDDPDEHFRFEPSGIVHALSERGAMTIDVFSLNRPSLVKRRIEVVKNLMFKIADTNSFTDEEIGQLTGVEQDYTALRRHIFGTLIGNQKRRLKVANVSDEHLKIRPAVDYVSEYPSRRTLKYEKYFAKTRYIERIEVKNIGAVGRLDLSLSLPNDVNAPWLIILGENGVGKSTLLKAIGLALASDRHISSLNIDFAPLLSGKYKQGFVKLYMSDGSLSELRLTRVGNEVVVNKSTEETLVLGYGATRLLPDKKHRSPAIRSTARLNNLFDPFVPLENAELWLSRLDKIDFVRVATSLKDLLNLPKGAQLIQEHEKIELLVHGGRTPLRQLSDGYQSTIALGADIMAVLSQRWKSMDAAEGIVLIDELGNHYHPRWRMRIVSALRRCFPRVQFVATTHDPLCLRGLYDNEVAVLDRGAANRVRVVEGLPPVSAMRVDQLLTSPYFGLHSTMDPDMEEVLKNYYVLLSKDRLTVSQKHDLNEIKKKMAGRHLIGDTPREQILLKAIDEHLAKASAMAKAINPAELPEELRLTLQQIIEGADIKVGKARRPKKEAK
jgi:uncharacterized protein (TIGR02646 family)